MTYKHKRQTTTTCPVCGKILGSAQAMGSHFRQFDHKDFKQEQEKKVIAMYVSGMGRKHIEQNDEIFFTGPWITRVISGYIKATGDLHDVRYTGRDGSCMNCGEEIRIMPSREKDGSQGIERHFCGKKCYDEYQRKYPNKVWNEGLTKETSEKVAQYAKSMSGFKWSDEMKSDMSKKKKQFFEDHPEAREQIARNNNHGYGICGVREDLGQFFRSTWEANFARMLRFEGVPYKYEGKGMAFDLGYTTYLVDFYLPEERAWIEVKGQKTAKWKMKVRVLKNLYGISVIVVDEKRYKEIEKSYENRVRNWEYCPSIMRKKGLIST